MLKHRVISSAFILVALFAAAIWMPVRGLIAILAIIGMLAAAEFGAFFSAAKIPQCRWVGVVGSAGLILVTGWGLLWGGSGLAAEFELLWLLAVTISTALTVMFRDVDRPLIAVSTTIGTVLYAPFLLNFMTKLLLGFRGGGVDGDGRGLVLYMILVVKTTDIVAFFVGSSIGRHKVFPRISPAKSWEGCLGGVIAATGVSALTCWLADGKLGVLHLSMAHAVVLGVLLSITGIVGDLIESMFKRAAKIKDSGAWILGLGGLLDVIDSLILAAPVFYLYCRWIVY